MHTLAEESRVDGNVGGHVYRKYFAAGCHVVVLLVIVLLSIAAEVSQKSLTLPKRCI